MSNTKKTVRIGTLNLPTTGYADVKNGKPVTGKVNEIGKAARAALKDYFEKTFGLDVVTKFAATANDADGEKPGLMIFARNLDEKGNGPAISSALFKKDLKISHKRENFLEIEAGKKGEVSINFKDINDEVLAALKDHRDKAKEKAAKADAKKAAKPKAKK